MAQTYAEIQDRLAEIAAAVQGDDLPLDEALDLYEEAIALAAKVGQAIEQDPLESPAATQTAVQE